MKMQANCTYETPCGWCTKWDKKCDHKQTVVNAIKEIKNLEFVIKSLEYPEHVYSAFRVEVCAGCMCCNRAPIDIVQCDKFKDWSEK